MGSNPVSGSYENGHWDDPPTEGGQMIQNWTLVEDQLMIAELRLYKNQKKKKKKKRNFHTRNMKQTTFCVHVIGQIQEVILLIPIDTSLRHV